MNIRHTVYIETIGHRTEVSQRNTDGQLKAQINKWARPLMALKTNK